VRTLLVSEFIFNAFINLKPVQRSEDGCDIKRFRIYNQGASKTVLNNINTVLRKYAFDTLQLGA